MASKTWKSGHTVGVVPERVRGAEVAATRKLSRKTFEKVVPQELRTNEILASAGARVTKRDVVVPISAVRHISPTCPHLVADAKVAGVDYTGRTNPRSLRTKTVPCPHADCYGSYFAARAEGHGYDADKVAWKRTK